MKWKVQFHHAFYAEFLSLPLLVQDAITSKATMLEQIGPQLTRPYADVLKGSKIHNLKELRVNVSDGLWRVLFVIDPKRKAILLVAGNKRGKNQQRFYNQLIDLAEKRYLEHLLNIDHEEI